MSDPGSAPPGAPMDFQHMHMAAAAMRGNPSSDRMARAIDLLGEGLRLAPLPPWDLAGPNDLSAIACLARAYRELGGAVHLLMMGYYGEVRVLLRAVFECASLSRMLAKSPEQAESWLKKEDRFPNDKVRKWWSSASANALGSPEEMLSLYGDFYKALIPWAHPTPVSCTPLIRPVDEDPTRPSLHLETHFIEEAFQDLLAGIAAAAIFVCFALRNCAVNEQAIDPSWRKQVYELSREVLKSDMPHLERNWEDEQRRYEDLRRKIQSADKLQEVLKTSPYSWQNLQTSGSADTDERPATVSLLCGTITFPHLRLLRLLSEPRAQAMALGSGLWALESKDDANLEACDRLPRRGSRQTAWPAVKPWDRCA
jgi:hypothetical protein